MVKRKGVLQACALLVVCSLVWSLATPAVQAMYDLPFNGNVIYGTVADYNLTLPTQVIQTSDRLIIEWDEFNIGSNKTFEFIQPNADAIVLNKVVGPSVHSFLSGQLRANGTVILINPAGILLGGQVEVGSLIASTLDVDYNQFINGTLPLTLRGQGGAPVSNTGRLRAAPGGSIALIGEKVYNYGKGSIEVDGGSAILAAGTSFAIHFDQEGKLVVFPIAGSNQRSTAELMVDPQGEIRADGGLIQLYAVAQEAALNLRGTLSAKSLDEVEGRIILYTDGGDIKGDTETTISGASIEADYVDVFGSHGVNVIDGSTITAEEIALEARADLKQDVFISDSSSLILDGYRNHPKLNIFAHGINIEGRIENLAIEPRGVTAEFDASSLTLGDTAEVILYGVNSTLAVTSSTSDPLSVYTAPGSNINTRHASFTGKNVDAINIEGGLHAGEVDFYLGGEVDSLKLGRVQGGAGLSRLRFFGADGPGSELTVNTLDVEGWTDLGVIGQIRAQGPVRIVANVHFDDGDLVIEDYSLALPTTIQSDQTIVLAAERAFINHTTYENVLFPGNGQVFIFSGTDTYGYNQGSLGFPEEFNVAYDPSSLPSRAVNTVFINQEKPAEHTFTITAEDIVKIFDNKPVEIDPADYTDLRGLQFRIDGGDRSGGINAGEYTIVPYGLAFSGVRVLFEPGTLTIKPRNILSCPLCWPVIIQVVSKRYGDETRDLSDIALDKLSLAEGHTLDDVGITLTVPGKTAPVGTYEIHAIFDPDHEQAKNYILPDAPYKVGEVEVYRRNVLLDFGTIDLVEGYHSLPDQLDFTLSQAPDYVSKEDFRPYIVVAMPPTQGDGLYPLEFSTQGGEEFLANYDLTMNGFVRVHAPDLQFMIEEGWKKAFPQPTPEESCLDRPVDPFSRPLDPSMTIIVGADPDAGDTSAASCDYKLTWEWAPPGQVAGGPPALMGFSSHSWPVVGRAAGAYLDALEGYSADAYLELLVALKDGNPDALGAVMPFLYAEFSALLQKDQSELTPEESAFLQEFLDSINDQRSFAATSAWDSYQNWRREQYDNAVRGCPLCALYYIEPVPPDTFLAQATTGFHIDHVHEEQWKRTVTAMASSLGAGVAGFASGSALASAGALTSVAEVIFPFAARISEVASAAASSLAGPIALGAAAIVALGFIADQVAKGIKYEEQMEEARHAAYTPLSLDDLRNIMNDNPEYVLAHFTLHVTRPGGLRLYIP